MFFMLNPLPNTHTITSLTQSSYLHRRHSARRRLFLALLCCSTCKVRTSPCCSCKVRSSVTPPYQQLRK
ncbi:uncharacterized protein DS421_18g602330 [Arachis hypogaea]|nr:uncharacterized protein DS421_18g602330 [Arachis hypogaea]